MRKLAMFAAAAAFVGMGGVASAAGLHEHESYKDQPVYAPSFTWTGFYLGGHGGGGWGTSDWVFGEQILPITAPLTSTVVSAVFSLATISRSTNLCLASKAL